MDVASSKPGCAMSTTRFFTSKSYFECHGFTLIELLVATAILAILISAAIPSIQGFVNSQRKITHLNAMASTLYLARSEAIMRNRDVVVCKSNDGETCSSSGEWEQGWLVFDDSNGDRNRDDEENILARHEQLSGITLYYRAFGSNHHIVYRAQGITKTNGTFTFCDSEGSEDARALIVFKTGRVRSATTHSDGSALTCPP